MRQSRRCARALASDLRLIPGVGAVNEERLITSGVTCLDDLRSLAMKTERDTESLAEYLRSRVGIRHQRHAHAIATFALELDGGEAPTDANDLVLGEQAPLTISLEGNIGVGKSTFLECMQSSPSERFEVLQEPVDQWRGAGSQGGNLLEAFYSNPSRYAYTFQNYVLMSRVQQAASSPRHMRGFQTTAHRRMVAPSPELLRGAPSADSSSAGAFTGALPPVLPGFGEDEINAGRIMERSIFSDRIVFAQAVRQAKWMSSLEMGLYESTFDSLLDTSPNVVPDGFIYLRARPETCLSRLEGRGRVEEGGISLEYLTELHENHEGWLGTEHLRGDLEDGEFKGLMSGMKSDRDAPARIGWINGKKSHAAIDRVPALILEYDHDVNFDAPAGASFQRM